jgi:hypothetical protein
LAAALRTAFKGYPIYQVPTERLKHGLVNGIRIVNLVYSCGENDPYYPIDYRIYDPTCDGKNPYV